MTRKKNPRDSQGKIRFWQSGGRKKKENTVNGKEKEVIARATK